MCELLSGCARGRLGGDPSEVCRVAPNDWHGGHIWHLVRVPLPHVGGDAGYKFESGAKLGARLSCLMHFALPAVDAVDGPDDVGGGGEARVDELAAEVGEPIGVGCGDGEFNEVGVGHAGVPACSSMRVMAAWASSWVGARVA